MTNSTTSPLGSIRPNGYGQTSENVVAQVYELIKTQELRPGDRLPPERELANQLGVSRTALRTGLRSLISMGLLKSRQGAGTFLADGPPSLASEPLRLLGALHGFTFDHMFEARAILEVSAAGLAALRATSDQMATLADELTEMHAALNDPQRYLIHDIRFHRAVAAASGNPTLATLVEMVSGAMYERRRQTIERAQDFSESLEMHRRIYRAIRSRVPEDAREAMRDHISRAQTALARERSEERGAGIELS